MTTHSRFSTLFGKKELTIETGAFAQHANGSAVATYGETVVLATAVMAKEPREGVDYFPLTVDYDEKFYAAGRIKGSRWIKREGRPTDEAILSDRLIDRTLRPLFDHRLRHEIQVIVTILSFDEENDPDIVALIAASTALAISDIPWNGPVGAVRYGIVNGQPTVNPTYKEREVSPLDIVVSGPKARINMIEAKANEVPEGEIIKIAEVAQEDICRIIDFQKDIAQEAGKENLSVAAEPPDAGIAEYTRSFLADRLKQAIYRGEAYDHMHEANELKRALGCSIAEKFGAAGVKEAYWLFEEEVNRIVHDEIIQRRNRPDGRAWDEIRDISCAVRMLPRTHGSGLFQRGETQALSVLTLGAPGLEQVLEGMEIVGTKRFMHHYNFPPFSAGETGRLGAPGRREIGHGALAEKALLHLIPPKDAFPYTIRIVSEILSSNGSSSMAAVCGSSLALMDAGVPITRPAAGIAIGLMMRTIDSYAILTDIQGPEDHHGDMDLKVAGTSEGITAIQMDVKVEGITPKILSEALARAKDARLKILEKMAATIPAPRKELSPHAPRVISLQINPSRIRDVIGPGGKMIREITGETGADIDIEEDGHIFITSKSEAAAGKAIEWIRNITREVLPGEAFSGRVARIMNFGAFVEILPGQQGLLHVSEILPSHHGRIENVLKVGDVVPVKIKDVDAQGRINLLANNAMRRVSSPRGPHRQKSHGEHSFTKSRRRPFV